MLCQVGAVSRCTGSRDLSLSLSKKNNPPPVDSQSGSNLRSMTRSRDVCEVSETEKGFWGSVTYAGDVIQAH